MRISRTTIISYIYLFSQPVILIFKLTAHFGGIGIINHAQYKPTAKAIAVKIIFHRPSFLVTTATMIIVVKSIYFPIIPLCLLDTASISLSVGLTVSFIFRNLATSSL